MNSTFVQPFISYTTPDAWTFTLNTETTYDWTADAWSVRVHLMASKLVKFGDQPVSLGGGLRYWAESPDNGPHDLAFRFTATLLCPTAQ